MFRLRKPSVTCTDFEVKVLRCIKEQKLIMSEIKKRYDQIYPPNVIFLKGVISRKITGKAIKQLHHIEIERAVISLFEKGFLKKEEVKEKSSSADVFSITPTGRGLITKQKKEKT